MDPLPSWYCDENNGHFFALPVPVAYYKEDSLEIDVLY
jgi:hypothetical protein